MLLVAGVVIVAALVGLGVWLLVGRGSSAAHSASGTQHHATSRPTPAATAPASPQALSPSPATPRARVALSRSAPGSGTPPRRPRSAR